MSEHPTIEVIVAAPVDTVWSYLRDPALVRRWHGWSFEGDGLEGEITWIYEDHAREADEPYVLELDDGEGDYERGDRIELTPVGDSETVVRITRPALAADAGWESSYDEITEGWRTFLHQLRFAVEHHPADDRRTIYLSGEGEPLRDAIGVTGDTGDHYEVTLEDGLDLRGEIWMRSTFQLGLTIEALGPGLVMFTDTADGAQVIVTTYGQSEAELAATAERWGRWFRARYPTASEPAV